MLTERERNLILFAWSIGRQQIIAKYDNAGGDPYWFKDSIYKHASDWAEAVEFVKKAEQLAP